ncbi:hypothetical protein FGG08_001381 [Glutinoglossum americanum]|uniref:Restriction of telomere capping protein 4 n=1 Tax=Glutinoglossum americanum TaxID=1670608 RepID=A0A9P8L0A9_9PEZI|nr:hypothetical protein FGG08_001381 [Glutinoglossum americanum]
MNATTRRKSPATDDEPQSSTDESEDMSNLPPPLDSSNGDSNSTMNPNRRVRTRVPTYCPPRATTLQDNPIDKKNVVVPTTKDSNGDSSISTSSRRSTRKPLASPSSPKRSLDEMQSEVDTHLEDDFGFVVSSQTQKKSKRVHTYSSSQGQSSQQSRACGQKKNTKVEKKNDSLHDKSHQSGFMDPTDRHSIDIPENLVENPFRDPSKKLATQLQPSAKGEEKEGAVNRFKMPRNVPSDILCSSREDQDLKSNMPRNTASDTLASSQEDLGSEFKMPTALPLSPVRKFRMPGGLPLEKHGSWNVGDIARDILNGKGDLCKILGDSDTILSNDSSSKPSATTEATDFSDSSTLSSPPGSPIFVSSQETPSSICCSRDVYAETLAARCPMCREAVDADFLSSFSDGRRMNVRNQAKFCRAHKQRSAKAEWAVRGYPDIKWDDLQVRIKKYHSMLEDVLEGRKFSYFKENLEAKIRSGRNRTLAQSMMSSDFQTLTPGYYGSRGSRIMMEAVMSRFSARIRKLAPKDRLISSGGVSGYVQAVMVPELAVQLVQEDMGLDSDAARKVLVDSVDIGDLLNEDDE